MNLSFEYESKAKQKHSAAYLQLTNSHNHSKYSDALKQSEDLIAQVAKTDFFHYRVLLYKAKVQHANANLLEALETV